MASGILKQWHCELTWDGSDNKPGFSITQQEGLPTNLISHETDGFISIVSKGCSWRHGLQVVER